MAQCQWVAMRECEPRRAGVCGTAADAASRRRGSSNPSSRRRRDASSRRARFAPGANGPTAADRLRSPLPLADERKTDRRCADPSPRRDDASGRVAVEICPARGPRVPQAFENGRFIPKMGRSRKVSARRRVAAVRRLPTFPPSTRNEEVRPIADVWRGVWFEPPANTGPFQQRRSPVPQSGEKSFPKCELPHTSRPIPERSYLRVALIWRMPRKPLPQGCFYDKG
jgi:hypothetical protein